MTGRTLQTNRGGDRMEWESLNEEQRQAVTATEGYIRVIAGAGAGKTRALSMRFAFLVNEIGILPGNILCVTFTNKSASEMRQRIHSLTGDNDTGYINTFHGFCVTVLQEESYAVQYPKNFLVLDNSDIDSMLQIIYEERNLTLRDMTFGKARDMIEIRKCIKEPEYYLDMINMSPEALRQKYLKAQEASDIIFYGYLYQEKKCFGLDYNDLIKFTLYIFEQKPDIRLKWQKRLEYIMIDEFQDIDDLQYRLMEVLCGYHKNLFVVGDPDQTIYTWRGASIKYLLSFDQVFPGAQTIMMMKNYRSTPEILNAANSLVEKNQTRIKKDLLPTRQNGTSVLCHLAENAQKEAEWIFSEIKRLTGAGFQRRDITILYRAHYVTRVLEEVFLKEQLPYRIYSGVQFFERMEIKDALSYLRMLVYRDDLSFLRIVNRPKRNIGQRRIRFLQDYAGEKDVSLYQALADNLDTDLFKGTGAADFVSLIEHYTLQAKDMAVSELLTDILDKSGYEVMLRTEGSQERLDNLAELKQSIYEFETTSGEETTLEAYLVHAALFTNQDTAESGDKVRLMTVHTAKGLEFPVVFLCGMNEGIFPSGKVSTQEGMEEERRLAFVALTRAKDVLYLTEAGGRMFDGAPRYPSRFILDIDPAFIQYTKQPEEGLIRETRSYISMNSRWLRNSTDAAAFKEGDRVVHSVLGPGTIVGIDQDKNAWQILFDCMDTPRTISFKVKLQGSET